MKKLPRVLRWALGGLVAFEVAYVAAGLILVKTGQVDRWLNNHPEKRVIRFESVWTVIPGVAHVRGFHMVNQGRGNQLELTVDSATGFVNPLELVSRRVHVVGLQAQGVEFRFRKRPKTPEEQKERAALVPPIEGVPFEPYSGPPKQKKTKPGWTVVFTRATVRGVRDVWMGQFRLKGPAVVAASVTVGPGDDRLVSIPRADIRFDGGEFLNTGDTALRDLALHVHGRMEPFRTKDTHGKALLALVSASLELEATSPGAVLLNRYFAKADWLHFDSGDRKISAQLEVDKGRLQAGGHVDLADAPLRMEVAGFIAEGQASARLETAAADGTEVPDLQVTVKYTDYGMRRLAEGNPVMHGDGLLIEAHSPADLAHFPPEDFGGRISLGKAEFPDLTFLNEFLPEGAGLAVKSGRGAVDGEFETGKGAACQGKVTVTTTDLILDAGGIETSGNATVVIDVPHGNLHDRTFGLDQTRVELTHFAFTSKGVAEDQPDWQGRIELTSGTLDLGETPGTDVRVDLTFSDTRPLVAFLSRNKPLKGWEKKLLTVETLTGESVARLEKGTTTIGHFGLRGGKIDIRFRALIDSRGAFGKARARYHALKAGIGLTAQDRDLKIVRVGTWYKKDDIPGMPPLLPEFEEIGAK